MKKVPVRKVSGEVFVYASEDIDKVKEAFSTFFPKKETIEEKINGGFGVTIKILRAEISGKKACELTKKIVSELKKPEKELLQQKLRLHIDEEGKFYLRFDKQSAYEKGKIILCSGEDSSIQVVLHLESFPASQEGYVKAAEELLGG
jgi:RNA binding exosome subunit